MTLNVDRGSGLEMGWRNDCRGNKTAGRCLTRDGCAVEMADMMKPIYQLSCHKISNIPLFAMPGRPVFRSLVPLDEPHAGSLAAKRWLDIDWSHSLTADDMHSASGTLKSRDVRPHIYVLWKENPGCSGWP